MNMKLFSRAEMFNKMASDPKNSPDRIIEILALKRGQSVADIGSGGGYFTFRFASLVGNDGRVYAVDSNPGFLEFINREAKDQSVGNIITVQVKDSPDLPQKSMDLIFFRNVTHHLPNRVEYFKKLMQFMKPEGRIAIIEYRKGHGISGLFRHYVPTETLINEMTQAGYRVQKEFDFLPEQSFTIFVPNK